MENNNHDHQSDRDQDSRSRSRTPAKSTSRSQSRSKSPSVDRRRRRRRTRSRSRSTFSRSPSPSSAKRLHIANLDDSVRRRDVEDAFGKYGKLTDIWVASYAPFYAFVVYERGEDAKQALKAMKTGYIRNCPIRTSIALPRNAGRRLPPPRRFYDSFDRYDRDRSYRRRSRSRSPRRRRSKSRSPRRSHRSRSRSYSR